MCAGRIVQPEGHDTACGANFAPAARYKDGIAALDECHVITHHASTGSVITAIKAGLEGDGLGDLVLNIADNGSAGSTKGGSESW